MCNDLEVDIASMKTLRSIMSLVSANCLIDFKKGHLQTLYKRVQQEFVNYFRLKEAEVKVSAFGLSGAGIYFVNSTIKTLLRIPQASQYFNKLSH